MSTFDQLGLSPSTLIAIKAKGFEEPTPIQAKVIPALLQGTEDIIGQAQTGTGKTAAFGLPLIEQLKEQAGYVQALIIAPTRELAIQISEEINSLKGKKRLEVVPIYGGQSIEGQLRRLRKGVDIIVGTPGRVMDHLRRKSLKLPDLSCLILDEADEMLNMGFIEDIEFIMQHTPEEKRTLLFSATMPQRIKTIAAKYMKDQTVISVKKEQLTADLTDQIYFEVSESDKFEALCRLIDMEEEFYGLIFCRTKIDVDTIASKLLDRGYDAEGLHGDISQALRQKVLGRFKKKQVTVLVATDVAARGLDVSDLTHVVNFALPQDPESYVHRIGRTGRAGKQGTAVTFITPSEYRKLGFIKRVSKADIKKARLPGIKDIVARKKAKLADDLLEIIKSGETDAYSSFAGELLTDNDPQEVVCALLKHAFKSELDEDNYRRISDPSINNKGKTRLFVALGRQNKATPRTLVSLIREKSGIQSREIQDIEIFDTFSFITVPFGAAEKVIRAFAETKGKRRPLVQKAAAKGKSKSQGRGGRRRRS